MSSFRDVLLLVPKAISNPHYLTWEDMVREYLYEPPINLERNPFSEILGLKVKVRG